MTDSCPNESSFSDDCEWLQGFKKSVSWPTPSLTKPFNSLTVTRFASSAGSEEPTAYRVEVNIPDQVYYDASLTISVTNSAIRSIEAQDWICNENCDTDDYQKPVRVPGTEKVAIALKPGASQKSGRTEFIVRFFADPPAEVKFVAFTVAIENIAEGWKSN